MIPPTMNVMFLVTELCPHNQQNCFSSCTCMFTYIVYIGILELLNSTANFGDMFYPQINELYGFIKTVTKLACIYKM